MERKTIEKIRDKQAFICDMDGVIYHGYKLLPGVKEFVHWLISAQKKFVFLTNSSGKTPRELQEKLDILGIQVAETAFYTSALATAMFLSQQKPGGSAFVIGEAGLISALYDVGYRINDRNPDYVVVGESRSTYNLENIEKAVNLVRNGARLIGTNPDLTGPIENGITPATKALIAPIELATGRAAYFVGKPNPLMMRGALRILDSTREESIIIGDRMDTDIIAGIEAEIETLLVLSGISSRSTLQEFPYQPDHVLNGVGNLVD